MVQDIVGFRIGRITLSGELLRMILLPILSFGPGLALFERNLSIKDVYHALARKYALETSVLAM